MEIKPSAIRAWSILGQRGTVFGTVFLELAEKIDNIKLITADLALLSGMGRFQKKYPEKLLNVGIAEQNMIGIAAGLSMAGDIVFATTYASFAAVRSLEQIRQNLSYLKCSVKVIGSSAGVTAAKSGISHWATEDVAFMRVLPNMTVFSPADSLEAAKTVIYAATHDGPMYIRLSGGVNCPVVYKDDYEFIPGKIKEIKKGSDIAVIATGLMVSETIKAAKILEKDGINISIYNMNTIKPLDKEGLDEIFKEYKLIVTAEEHNILGGMGSAIAEYKVMTASAAKQVFIGFNDTFTKSGSQGYVWEQAGITKEHIAEKIKQEWEKIK